MKEFGCVQLHNYLTLPLAVTTSQEYQHHGSRIILASLGLCVSILKNTWRLNRNPLLTRGDRRSHQLSLPMKGEISDGNFPPGV